MGKDAIFFIMDANLFTAVKTIISCGHGKHCVPYATLLKKETAIIFFSSSLLHRNVMDHPLPTTLCFKWTKMSTV